MRFFPGCACCGATVSIPACPSGAVGSLPSRLYVTVIDEDGDCPDLADLTFTLDHYAPFDGPADTIPFRSWYPVGFNGVDPLPQFPCAATIDTQWIGIACLGSGGYFQFRFNGLISGVITGDPINYTAAQLAAVSPVLFEWVGTIDADVFDCCDIYPANIRIIVSETAP